MGRRPRGRPNRRQHGGSPRSTNYDSNGPEGRIRGNAHQVYEKYVALARDALSSGDRVSAETYYQHAEHYFRILNDSTDPRPNGYGQDRRPGGNGRAALQPAENTAAAAPPAEQAPLNAQEPAKAAKAPGAGVELQAPERPGPKPAAAAEPDADEESAEEVAGNEPAGA
ncbi:MAG: DUF4167 domain-containing protein [Kiloniellaceae bacterium]